MNIVLASSSSSFFYLESTTLKKQAFYQGDSEDKVEEQEKPHLPDKSGRRRPNRRPKWPPGWPPAGKIRSQPRFDSGPGKDWRLPTRGRRRPPSVDACGTRGRNQPPVGQTGRQAARQDGRRPPAGPPAAAGIRRDPICQRKDGRRPFVTEGGRPLWPPTADGTGHDPLSATRTEGGRREAEGGRLVGRLRGNFSYKLPDFC
ncbi:unnamed protein product [Cuscuta epithymum]|uniref:Uncharacterized protein n=1 Tax=Cuscuta epithymum TaxID=186058 RepID=A0AAV0EK47_9ASTE|nr:unnamed protein product [Cuscuta epithymum]